MATDGKLTSSQNEVASHIVCDLTCMPCLNDGKNTKAVYYCVNCRTYYCQRCVESHEKSVKNHVVLDEIAMKFGQGQTSQPAPSRTSTKFPADTCDEHIGEIIKMYCGYHDVVCCSICIAMNHRSCSGIEYVPHISRTILQSQDKEKPKARLKEVKKEMLYLKLEKLKFLQEVRQRQKDSIKGIQMYKKGLQRRLEELEKSSVSKVKTKCKKISGDTRVDIDRIDQMLKDVELQLRRNDTDDIDDDTQRFVDVKKMEMQAAKGKDFSTEIRKKPFEVVDYNLNASIWKWSKDVKSFGSLKVSKRMLRPFVNILDLTKDSTLSAFATSLQADLAVSGIPSDLIQLSELDGTNDYTVVVCQLETADTCIEIIKKELRRKIILVPLYITPETALSKLRDAFCGDEILTQVLKLQNKKKFAVIKVVTYSRIKRNPDDENSCALLVEMVKEVVQGKQ